MAIFFRIHSLYLVVLFTVSFFFFGREQKKRVFLNFIIKYYKKNYTRKTHNSNHKKGKSLGKFFCSSSTQYTNHRGVFWQLKDEILCSMHTSDPLNSGKIDWREVFSGKSLQRISWNVFGDP